MTQRGSLRVWLILLTLIAVIPFLGLLAYTTYQSWMERQQRATAAALSSVQIQAQRVDDQLLTIGEILVAIGALAAIDPPDIAANDALLKAVKATLPAYYSGLALVDPQGRNIGFGVPQEAAARQATVADRAYFQAALRTRGLVVGNPVISRSTGMNVIPIAQALVGPDGTVRAVALAAIDLRRLQALLDPGALPPDSVITLVTGEGVVLARSLDPATWVGQNIAAVPSVQEVLQRQEGVSIHTSADGVKRVAAFTTLDVAPWTIYAGIPTATVFQPVRAALVRDGLLGLGSLLLTLALATVVAGQIARPIRRLADDAAALGAGQLRRRSTVRAEGEIGRLVHSFNQMAEALERQLHMLQASRAEVRQLAEVVERAGDSILISTPAGVVLYANPAAIDLYGTRPGQRLEPDLAPLLVGREAPRPAPADPYEPSTIVIPRPSGPPVQVEVLSFPLRDPAGQLEAVASIGRDITERKRMEAQLLQAQKLESVGRLAGGIAHDFNNLLTVISGYTDLALDPGESATHPRFELEEIRKAALQAQRLTRQLLTFARKQPVQVEVLDLQRLINAMEQLLRLLLGAAIALKIQIDDDARHIRGDPGQIEQVLVNLITNARDAMPDGGQVTITAEVVTVGLDDGPVDQTLAPGRYVQLVVADTGPGIAPGIREHLFEPFFTTKPAGQGTGLGLAICYRIVTQHGGTMVVDSANGGTGMHVLLPLASETAIPPEDVPSLAPRGGTETVLIVEDMREVRELAARVLREHGYTVLEATNGEEALAQLQARPTPVDLIVSDVVMPGLGGIDLAEQARAAFPTTPIILMSGYIDQAARAERLLPPLAILHKPFAPRRLLQLVRATLDEGDGKTLTA